jgi:putative transposase
MLMVSGMISQLVVETFRWFRLAFRSSQSIRTENLLLRRQLALYVERGVKPRRVDPITRITPALLSRFFNWRDALVVVRPETMIRAAPGRLEAALAPEVSTRPAAHPQASTSSDSSDGE